MSKWALIVKKSHVDTRTPETMPPIEWTVKTAWFIVIFKIFYITANDPLTPKLIVCSIGYIKWTKIFNSITIKQYILTLSIRCFIDEFTSTIKLSIPEEIIILWSLTIDTEYFNFKSKKVRCLISRFTLNTTLLWLILRTN